MSDAGREPRAQILVTGDELLRGFVQDANSGFLAAELRGLGIPLQRVQVVGDELDGIVDGLLRACEEHSDLVIVTGGLGPTHDDRTTEAVSRVTGRPLELRSDALEVVESRVRAHGRMRTPEEEAVFAPGNRKQATLPAGAAMLEPLGTAPGYVVGSADERVFVVLPGPPSELRHAWRGAVRTPLLRGVTERVAQLHERIVRIWGVPESHASQVLAATGHDDSERCRVTICARDGELEISVRGSDVARVDGLVDALRERFGAAAFAIDDERPVAALVGELLAKRDWMLAVAESCTGGLIGGELTAVAGSSGWFAGGVVSYADETKVALLGIPQDDLREHGAVSSVVAAGMAGGARRSLDCAVGLGVTGIAGPGGGTAEKPVGTVHVAVEAPDLARERVLRIPGDRETVRRRTVRAALHLVRELLVEKS